MNLRRTSLPILALSFPTSAPAALFNYSASAIGSGMFNGQSFSSVRFTVSTLADSASVTTTSSGSFAIVNVPTTITVEGLGSDRFTNAIQVVSNPGARRGGFGDSTLNASLFFVNNAAFANYDLRSAVGPLSGTPLFSSFAFPTLNGSFRVSQSFSGQFRAVPVPEPATFAMLALGVAALRRRRTASR